MSNLIYTINNSLDISFCNTLISIYNEKELENKIHSSKISGDKIKQKIRNSSYISVNYDLPNIYYNILNQCTFSLVPHGYLHPETYRLYESLECGSIPIIENPYNFFDKFLKNHPFYSISVWSEAKEKIENLVKDQNKLNEVADKTQEWWVNYKKELKDNIIKILNV